MIVQCSKLVECNAKDWSCQFFLRLNNLKSVLCNENYCVPHKKLSFISSYFLETTYKDSPSPSRKDTRETNLLLTCGPSVAENSPANTQTRLGIGEPTSKLCQEDQISDSSVWCKKSNLYQFLLQPNCCKV